MLSWVFRHRARLGVIYGLTPVPSGIAPLPPAPEPEAHEEAEVRPEALGGACEESPGTLARRERWVLLRPMERRSA